MTASDAVNLLLGEKVEFLLLQFTDILGSIKTVEIPAGKFDEALAGAVTFDGSALEGFHRTIESELLLSPDLDTLRIASPIAGEIRTARLICDVHNLDHTAFEGCPRTRLNLVLQQFQQLGYTAFIAPEIEFFLFQRDAQSKPTTHTDDPGSYFDLVPMDR